MPQPPDKLAEGFPLPLLKHIQLYDPVLEIYKVSGFRWAFKDWGKRGLVSFPGSGAIAQRVRPSPALQLRKPGLGRDARGMARWYPEGILQKWYLYWGRWHFDTACPPTASHLPPSPTIMGNFKTSSF